MYQQYPGATQVDKLATHDGAVAFIHRFGFSLNEHVHIHVCAVDGVFEAVVPYHWATRKRVFVAVWQRCIAGPEFVLKRA